MFIHRAVEMLSWENRFCFSSLADSYKRPDAAGISYPPTRCCARVGGGVAVHEGARKCMKRKRSYRLCLREETERSELFYLQHIESFIHTYTGHWSCRTARFIAANDKVPGGLLTTAGHVREAFRATATLPRDFFVQIRAGTASVRLRHYRRQ